MFHVSSIKASKDHQKIEYDQITFNAMQMMYTG